MVVKDEDSYENCHPSCLVELKRLIEVEPSRGVRARMNRKDRGAISKRAIHSALMLCERKKKGRNSYAMNSRALIDTFGYKSSLRFAERAGMCRTNSRVTLSLCVMPAVCI